MDAAGQFSQVRVNFHQGQGRPRSRSHRRGLWFDPGSPPHLRARACGPLLPIEAALSRRSRRDRQCPRPAAPGTDQALPEGAGSELCGDGRRLRWAGQADTEAAFTACGSRRPFSGLGSPGGDHRGDRTARPHRQEQVCTSSYRRSARLSRHRRCRRYELRVLGAIGSARYPGPFRPGGSSGCPWLARTGGSTRRSRWDRSQG